MSNYLSIATEDDFPVGPESGCVLYPILAAIAILFFACLHIHSRANSDEVKTPTKENKKNRVSNNLRDIFFLCTCAFLFGSMIIMIFTNISSSLGSYTDQARIQNASIVVKSLESYKAISLEKRNQIEKELKENKTVANDPVLKLEYEAELRVEDRNLAYADEQLKIAKGKKENLELFLASNQDRSLLKEYRRLRIENAEMSKMLQELMSGMLAIKDDLAAIKSGSCPSSAYQLEKRGLAKSVA